ncbi:tyrosine-type recombinase/integrase [Bacillus mycoides]|uniref:tyrosine-type recombinase/integrase n=1 Tax=Bacillus mycoides TaxID=1405 RepID=UPI001C035528|nr:site-specific integrase [Bacillus mycoides]QWG92786.1 integrase [Bacillus mycoides]
MIAKEIQNTIEGFSSYLSNKGRKASTIKRYIYDVESFIQWLHQSKKFTENNIFESLHKKDFESFFKYLKENRQYSDKTIHRIYIVLNRLYEYFDLSSPIEGVIQIDPPDRTLRREDFVSLRMVHVHFENNTLSIPEDSKVNRTIHLKEEDKLHLYNYYKTIPEPVRPKYHSNDPLFIAFDFTRGTYHWSYDDAAPKFLTEISIQKMIRLEVKRANLRKGISAQHFRNTYILRRIQGNYTPEQIMPQIGFKSNLSLKRYSNYYKRSIANADSHPSFNM